MAGKPKQTDEQTAPEKAAEPVVPVATSETPSDATPTVSDDTAEFDKSFDDFADDKIPPTDPLQESNLSVQSEATSAEPAGPEDIGSSQAAGEGKPEPGEAPPVQDPPAPSAAPTPTPDIWADSTPEQKAAFEAAEVTAHKWQSDQGRAAADARRIAQLEATINAAAAPRPAAAPADGVLVDVLKSDDWQSVEKELPELAAPLKKVLEGFQTENTALKTELATFSHERRDQVADAQIRIVKSEHSDWESVTDDTFVQWVGTQPIFIQQMFNRNADRVVDGLEAAHLVSLYKASDGYVPPVPVNPAPGSETNSPAPKDNGGAPNKRDRDSLRRLDGNVSVPSKGPGAPSGPPDEFEAAFDHFAAQGS